MIIREEDNFVLTNNDNNETKFGIAASAKAFKILSSSLYERKIEAIIRELSCNAYDSHVQAGYPDRPFHVHLPNTWEPEFSVEDFGVGLDDKQIEGYLVMYDEDGDITEDPDLAERAEQIPGIFTTFFASDKTGSNDVIGGLGLGSKSPYAYTDAYTIRARKNGKERVYSAYISSNGEPAVSLMSCTDTEEPNGVKITVPVKESDFSTFRNDAQKVFSWFDVMPEVFGCDWFTCSNEKAVELKDKGFVLTEYQKNGYNRNYVVVVMGNVAYRVNDISSTFSSYFDKEKVFFSNHGIYIKFDIGDLDVAASRETISFDEETTRIFVEKLKDLIENHNKDIQDHIDNNIDHFIQACEYIDTNVGFWAYPLFTWEGVPIEEYLVVDHISELQRLSRYLEVNLDHRAYIKSRNQRSVSSMNLNELGLNCEYSYMKYPYNNFKDYSFNILHNIQTTGMVRNARDIARNNQKSFVFCISEDLNDIQKQMIKDVFGENTFFHCNEELNETIKEERRKERELRKQNNPKDPHKPKTKRITKEEIRYSSLITCSGEHLTDGIIDINDIPDDNSVILRRKGCYLYSESGDFIRSNANITSCFSAIAEVYNLDMVIIVNHGSFERALKILGDKPRKIITELTLTPEEMLHVSILQRSYANFLSFFYNSASEGYIGYGENMLKEKVFSRLLELSKFSDIREKIEQYSDDTAYSLRTENIFHHLNGPEYSEYRDLELDLVDKTKQVIEEIKESYPLLHCFQNEGEAQHYMDLEDFKKDYELESGFQKTA